MAPQAALAFLNKISADSALHDRVTAAGNIDMLLSIAAEAGFVFTAQEWQQATASNQSGELSENDLDNVAGGALNAYLNLRGQKTGDIKGSVTQK